MDDRLARINELKQMAARDPADSLTFYLLGLEQLHAGQFDEAAAAMTRCLDLTPRHTAAVRLLADAQHQAGRFAEARATYRRAIALAEETGDLQVAKEARALLKKLDISL